MSMADPLPSGLLEACVVVGPSNDKLKEVYEVKPYCESDECNQAVQPLTVFVSR